MTARVFQGVTEIDPDGTQLKYVWTKYDKNGIRVEGFRGKSIEQSADDVDQKAVYHLEAAWLVDAYLLTRSGANLTTRSGNYLTLSKEAD